MQDLLQTLEKAFHNDIPYTKPLDGKIIKLNTSIAEIYFPMKENLIGNILNGNLHGGAIATALDSVGGLLTFAELLERMQGYTKQEIMEQMAKTSTANMYIDYLSPGKGKNFIARATTIKNGKRLFRAHMQLFNEKNTLIANGNGTYLFS